MGNSDVFSAEYGVEVRKGAVDMETVDCLIIGGGVMGLAIARSLAMSSRQVVVLEQESQIAQHSSSRNSQVIHAGLFYEPDSLKAWACRRGQRLLYLFAETHAIAAKPLGKLVLAVTPSEHEALLALRARAIQNGVDDLLLLKQSEVRRYEPDIVCYSALFSPSSGIIDAHQFVAALANDFTASGGNILTNTSFLAADLTNRPFTVTVGGESECQIKVNHLINAAGLFASQVSEKMTGLPISKIPPTIYAKGQYFKFTQPSPFKHLVYPLSDDYSLGIHATLNMAGETLFGPDFQWVDSIDYQIDSNRKEDFYQKIRRYYPAVKREQLQADYAGIRPIIGTTAQPRHDFLYQDQLIHGIAGYRACYGINSPGLTAALTLAEKICDAICIT